MAIGRWWTFCEKFGGALLALGAILAVVDTGIRVAAIVVGGAGFLILVVGLLGQLWSTQQTGDRQAVPALPAVGQTRRPLCPGPLRRHLSSTGTQSTLPTWPRRDLPIIFYDPTNWFPWSRVHQPDVILRVAIALPGVVPHLGGGEPRRVGVTRLDGEARERVIEQALNLSPLTKWLIAQRAFWHWDETELAWGAYGSGHPEFSEYRFLPSWPSLAGDRVPFQARAAVETGWQTTGQSTGDAYPAIQIACDLTLNLLELDSERRRGPIRHTTTPSPIPAALRPAEVVDYLLNLWPITDVAATLAPHLLPRGEYGHGQVAAWMVSNVQLERVIDLRSLSRRPESSDAPDGSTAALWPMVDERGRGEPRDMLVDMLVDMLEKSGYRQLGDLKADLQGGIDDR